MAAMAAPAAAAPAAADVAASAPKLLRGAEATGMITGLLCRKGLSPARALVRPMAFFSAYPAAAYPLRERCARFGRCVGLSLLDATSIVTAIDRHVDPQVFDLGTRPWDLQLVDWYLEADMTPARQDCPRSVRVVLGVPAAVTQCVFCACKLLPPEDVPALAVDELAKTEASAARIHTREHSVRCAMVTRFCSDPQCNAEHDVDHATRRVAGEGAKKKKVVCPYRFGNSDDGKLAGQVDVMRSSAVTFVTLEVVEKCTSASAWAPRRPSLPLRE